jgi:hypothetical protein
MKEVMLEVANVDRELGQLAKAAWSSSAQQPVLAWSFQFNTKFWCVSYYSLPPFLHLQSIRKTYPCSKCSLFYDHAKN